MVSFGEVGVENLHADPEVGLVEVVGDVPADLSVLAPLLHDGVEEGEDEDERGEGRVRGHGQGAGLRLEVCAA